MTKKRQSSPRARRLVFENLETRELLSINPICAQPDAVDARNAAIYAAVQDDCSIRFTLDDSELSNVRAEPGKLEQPSINYFRVETKKVWIEWNWTGGNGGFDVLYRKASEKDYQTYASTREQRYEISGLEPETQYYFKIVAKGDGETTLDSDAEKYTVIKTARMQKLETPKITDFTTDTRSISITWSAVPSAWRYRVEYCKASENYYAECEYDFGSLTAKTSFLEPGATYVFRVTALGDGGYALLDSAPVMKAIKTLTVPQLAQPKITSITSDLREIEFAWNEVPNATGYTAVVKSMTDKTETTHFVSSQETHCVVSGLLPSTSYQVSVVALGDGKTSINSNAETKTIKTKAVVQLPQPTITQTEIFRHSANVAWQDDPRAIGFRVMWRAAKEKSWRSTDVEAGITNYSIAGLDPASSYQVKVVALGDNYATANSSETKYKTIKTKAVAPLTQPDIIGYDVGRRSLYVQWRDALDASAYRFEWRAANDKTWSAVFVEPTRTEFTLTNLEPNTSYVVRVVAIGDGYETLDSTDKKTKTYKTKKADAPLTQPDIIEYSVAKRALYVKWREAVEADGYRFEWRAANEKTWNAVSGEPSQTEYELTDLEPNTSYVVRVVAVGNGTETFDSTDKKTKTIKTKALDVLEQPTITQTDIFYREANVAWQNDTRAIGYRVMWRAAKEKSWQSADVVAGTENYSIQGLEPGTSYQVKVVALGDNFETLNSSETKYKTIKTKAGAPLKQPSIIGYAVYKRALYVQWNDVQDAVGYRVEWRAANDKTWSAVFVEPTRTEFTLTNLNPNTSYVVRVIAVGNGTETLDSTDKKTKTYKTLPLDVLEQPTITETKISPTRIEIYWNPIEYANGYTVNYKRVGTKDTVSVSVDISTYTHEERLSFETEPDASYIVSVVAKGDDRETCDSSAKKTVTLTAKEASELEPLAAPTILSYQTFDTAIVVNWSKSTQASGYEIAYKKVGSNKIDRITVPNSGQIHNSYTISGLVPGAKYSISITALSDNPSFADSKATTKTIATSKAPKLLAPTGISVRRVGSWQEYLDWTPVDNARGYEIVMSEIGRPTETKTVYLASAPDATAPVDMTTDLPYGLVHYGYNVKIRALGVENYLDSDFSQFIRVYS